MNSIVSKYHRFVCAALLLCIGCGGGGGSGETAGFYGGTWDLRLQRVMNDCGANVPGAAVATVLVNQEGRRVVVDSGSIVLTGETTDDDGFSVIHVEGRPNGCELGTAYVFSNASDGDATVGLALVSRCGSSQCTVGYGGNAIKRSSRSLEEPSGSLSGLGEMTNALEEQVFAGEGDRVGGTTEESALEVAELSAPAE